MAGTEERKVEEGERKGLPWERCGGLGVHSHWAYVLSASAVGTWGEAFFFRKVKVKSLNLGWLFSTPWTIVYQAPPSMEFSRQENWSGLPFFFRSGGICSSLFASRTPWSLPAQRRFLSWIICMPGHWPLRIHAGLDTPMANQGVALHISPGCTCALHAHAHTFTHADNTDTNFIAFMPRSTTLANSSQKDWIPRAFPPV